LKIKSQEKLPNTKRQSNSRQYKCNGTHDADFIQAAILVLGASGGTLRLSEGVFTLRKQINLTSNIGKYLEIGEINAEGRIVGEKRVVPKGGNMVCR
jgi:polygalacturonase